MQANLTNRDATRVPAPARQVELRAAARRGRPAGARPRRSTSRRCRRAARSSSRSRWTTGTPRSTTPTPAHAIARAVNGRAGADPGGGRASSPRRLDAAANPVLVAGPDIDASGGWDAAVALAERQRLPVWAIPAPGGGRLGFPEGHPIFQGVLPPAIGPVAETLAGHDLVARRRLLGVPLLPLHPRAAAARGRRASSQITSDPDEAARAPMGDAIVADVALDAATLLEQLGESDRAPAEPRPSPASRRRRRPDQPAPSAMHALAERLARGRDRRLEAPSSTARAAQPAAPLAPGQLLLRRRRRARLRARGGGRRPARPARPPGRLRARRGLGPVRDHGALDAPSPTRSRSRSSCCATSEYAILKWFAAIEQVEGAPGLDLPGLDSPAVAAGYGVDARRVAERRGAARGAARRDRVRTPASSSRSGSPPACGCSEPESPGDGPARSNADRAHPAQPGAARRPRARLGRRGHARAAAPRARARLLGADRVLTRALDLVRYASDASPYRLFPQAVVMARDAADVAGDDGVRAADRDRRSSSAPAAPASTASPRPTGSSSTCRRHFRGVAVEDGGPRAGRGRDRARPRQPACSPRTAAGSGPIRPSTDIACVGGVIANNSGGMRCGTTPTPTARSAR